MDKFYGPQVQLFLMTLINFMKKFLFYNLLLPVLLSIHCSSQQISSADLSSKKKPVQKILDPNKCYYYIVHPLPALFLDHPGTNTGKLLNPDLLEDKFSDSIWNQETIDGVHPDSSIYIQSTCTAGGSLKPFVQVKLLERASGRTIPLKETYLPSRKIVQYTPLIALKDGASHYLVLHSKNKKAERFSPEYTRSKDTYYYGRLYHTLIETIQIPREDIVYVQEVTIRSLASIAGPFLHVRNYSLSHSAEKLKITLTEGRQFRNSIELTGRVESALFCHSSECKPGPGNSEEKIEFRIIIPKNGKLRGFLLLTADPFELRGALTDSGLMHAVIENTGLGFVYIVNTTGQDSAGQLVKNWILNYILTDALGNKIPELLEKKGLLKERKNIYSVFGFNVTDTENRAEMIFNPFLKLIFTLKTKVSTKAQDKINPIRPYEEMQLLFNEGLFLKTYRPLTKNKSFSEQINQAKVIRLNSLLNRNEIKNMNLWISSYE